MTALDRFVLPPDVVIAPVAELPAKLRDRLDHEAGDCAVTRPRTRTQSSVVDAETAALLERFREPTTIVDAVIAASAAAGAEPDATLADAFPVLRGFVADGVLVREGSALAEPIAATLAPGERVGAFELVESVHLLADTEVHLARAADGSHAALKIARASAGWARDALAREAGVLARLDGDATPRLLASGELDGRPYVASAWCAGVDVQHAAGEARALGDDGRAALVELVCRVAEAYALVHRQGVLHGDVHPRNVLAAPDGAVTLIDFGFAVDLQDTETTAARGGVDFFLEPEAARARIGGLSLPPSPPGERYALGALLYLLLTGAHTHAFALDPDELLRQLAEQPPLPFAEHGVTDLPALERVVLRALARDPVARWDATDALASALRAAAAQDAAVPSDRAAAPRRAGATAAAELVEETLARLAAPGPLYAEGIPAPTASAMNGAAGFAHALLRVAALRGDPGLLAAADLWSARATQAIGSHAAFYNEELEIVPEIFGDRSFYHHAPGVHAVRATVALGRGDDADAVLALQALAQLVGRPCEQLDVTFGRAGLLLGCAATLEALPPGFDDGGVRAAGDARRDELWRTLAEQPPLGARPPLGTLGAAHGWAGYLFALLRWAEATASPPPDGVDERLDQLAALAVPAGRGMRWPYEAGGPPPVGGLVSSWCNGTAGYVELWALAHRRSGEQRFARLAQQAAWTTWEQGVDAGGDLCCGFAGRAYALLGMHRLSGERLWHERARRFAEHATARVAAGTLRRDSLYKGVVGVALLIAELDDPAHAGMPLFARAG